MNATPASSFLRMIRTTLLVLAFFGAIATTANAESRHQASIRGTVSAVDSTAGTVTIKPPHGAEVALLTNAQTLLTLNGAPAKLAEVPVGAVARAVYDRTTLVAARIVAFVRVPVAVIEGTVTAAGQSTITITPEHGAPVALTTNGATRVLLDGAPSTLAAVAVGDDARALYDSASLVAIGILVESPHHALAEIGGQVTAVAAASITITPKDGSPVTLGADAATKVILDLSLSTVAAIPVGATAHALYDSASLVAIVIQAQSPHHELAEVEGQVTAVSSSSITIAPEEGAPVTLGTSAATQVFLGVSESSLASIADGDLVRALYDSATLIAVVIQAYSPSSH